MVSPDAGVLRFQLNDHKKLFCIPPKDSYAISELTTGKPLGTMLSGQSDAMRACCGEFKIELKFVGGDGMEAMYLFERNLCNYYCSSAPVRVKNLSGQIVGVVNTPNACAESCAMIGYAGYAGDRKDPAKKLFNVSLCMLGPLCRWRMGYKCKCCVDKIPFKVVGKDGQPSG